MTEVSVKHHFSSSFSPSDFDVKWKTTVVIPTGPAPIQSLKWSILSLFLRSDLSKIDQIIVSINGPDARCGDTKIQDEKESFCHELAADGYPITVIRSWSRVGYSPPIEIAMPLVKTDSYLLMHDDVFVTSNVWQEEAEKWLADNEVLAVVQRPVFSTKLKNTVYQNIESGLTTITYLPCINTCFSLFKRSANIQWNQYWCSLSLEQSKTVDVSSINPFYLDRPKTYTMLIDKNFHKTVEKFTRLSMNEDCKHRPEVIAFDCGAWPAQKIMASGKIATFSSTAHHLEAMSEKPSAAWEAANPDEETRELVKEIQASKYAKYYQYSDPKPFDFNGLRPLVCVIVYDRINTISHWIKAWKVAKQYGGKLLVVQNTDGTDKCNKVTEEIAALEPDYHWTRFNDKQSAKHWFELLKMQDVDYDWNVMLAFCDDCIPIRKDFMMPLLDVFSRNDNLGLTGGVLAHFEKNSDYINYMQRGVCLGIKREVLGEIEQIANQAFGDFSVNCETSLWRWVKEAGYSVSATDYDWSLIYGWDCDNQGSNDLWEKAEANLFEGKSQIYELT